MAWELDPDLALHSRLSFGRRPWRWLLLTIATSVAASVVTSGDRVPTILAVAGLALMAAAAPYGALCVMALERNHRLDLLRLTGRAPLRLMLASLLGTSWLLMALGVSLLLASRHAGVVQPLAVLSMGMSAALILLSTPGLHDADERMQLVVVMIVAVCITAAGWTAPVPILLLAGGAAAAGAALPIALQRMRRHRSVRSRALRNPLRGMVRLSRSRRPEFSRSVLSSGSLMIAALILGGPNTLGLPLRAWMEWPRPDPAGWAVPLGFVAYIALTIAALGCSTRARVEHASGGLDRIRLSPQHPWAVVLEMAAGISLPLLLLSTWGIGWVCLGSPSAAAVRAWPAVAAVALFGGLAEGLQGRKLGTYLVPLALICTIWHSRGVPWWPLFGASFLLAASAAASVAGPEKRPVTSRA